MVDHTAQEQQIIDEATFLTQLDGSHREWVKGVVIEMPPVTLKHDQIVAYLRKLLEAYFSLRRMGQVVGDPFVMRLADVGTNRQPDLQVILAENQANLTQTYMNGPADICIEVVSPGSTTTDYGEKFQEYEAGGVVEYWIIDPVRSTAHFYQLGDDGRFAHHMPDDDGHYHSERLPELNLHVPTLWADDLPDYGAIWQMVQAMVNR